MTATAAEALELALWLHRVPTRRTALLGHPLPDGIGQLLRVAGGAPDQVAAAARITGAEEGTVLEAVRFYLQQILFHEDADAYRVLGLRPGDSQERAREHHRLLQQWLHPDRSGGDAWESVYAVRINQAWSHLRTPQARAAYDVALAGAGVASAAFAADPPATPGVAKRAGGLAGWERDEQTDRSRSRNLTIAVLLGCAGLLVLIALRRESPPQWPEYRPLFADAPADAAPEDEAPIATLGTAVVETIDARPESMPTPALTTAAASASAVAPERIVAGPGMSVAGPAAAAPVIAAPLAMSAPTSRVAQPSVVPSSAVKTTIELGPAPPPSGARTTPVTPRPPTIPVAAPALAAIPPQPAAPVPAAMAPIALAPTPIPDAFERMNQARNRASEVLTYLGDRSAGLPPVWNDIGTMQLAEEIRTALHERHGTRRIVRLELHESHWRLSADGARLESRYRVGEEHGLLGLDFAWRERQLLVRAISMEPDE